MAALGVAQEGHPLSGSWHGDWGGASGARNRIVLFMKWDNKNITGTLNPGPRGGPLTTVTLDPVKWMVHIEGDAKDQSGAQVHVVADGKLDNLGSYNRTITGTWTQGAAKGEFKISRD